MTLEKPTSRLVPKRPTQRYRYVRLRWHLFFALFDFLGGTFFYAVRLLSSPFRGENRKNTRYESPQSILVLQLDHLGDAILSTGMLRVLRKNYPEARLDLLVGPWNRSLFEKMVDEVDRVLVFDGGGRLGRLSSMRWIDKLTGRCWPFLVIRYGLKLRRQRYDLGIDVRGEMPHALLMWIAGIPRRIGWAAGGGGFLLTDSPDWVPDRPEIESRRAILETLEIEANWEEMVPRLKISGGACPRDLDGGGCHCVGNEVGINNKCYIVLHLTAGTRAKEWPAEHWAKLIDKLAEHKIPKIVLVGSPADHIIGQTVEGLVTTDRARLCNLIGKLTLVELADVLHRAEWMIGADSGPAHMAAAVGTRTIVLFSGTNRSEQWRPPGEHVTVLEHDVPCRPCHQKRACPVQGHPCMTRITPEQVLSTLITP